MNVNIFCQAIEDKLKRRLGLDEIDAIKKYLVSITLEPGTSLKLAFKYHLEQVYRILAERQPSDEIDLKEYQIAKLNTNKEDGQLVAKKHSEYPDERELLTAETAKLEALFLIEVAEVYDLSKAIAPKSKLKYNYLMLDSDNCYEIPDSRDKFTWLLREEHTILQKGYINLHSKMRNIVMARLGRMTMAHMHTDFTLASIDRNRFAFGFEEFASQALITPSGTKFQFIEFLPEYDTTYGTTVVLSPFNSNRGWFRFRERFKMLDKLSLTITNLNTSTKVQLPNTRASFPAIHRAGQSIVHINTIDDPIEIPNGLIFLQINPQLNSYNPLYPQTQNIYTFSDYNSGNAIIDAAWNVSNMGIEWREYLEYYYPIPLLPIPPGPVDINFTITVPYLPRFTGVLELISEDDSDDDTPI